jgi:ABC-2 type transport system ATP-binding protein
LLELLGLRKTYGDVVALDDCTFRAQPGRLLGFLGPNGAGKTTAMRAVFGLVSLDAGTITWRGSPVTLSERQRFGYMPETRGLYPKMRIHDQLTYLGRLHGMNTEKAASEAEDLLATLGLTDRARDPLEKLSHGNQQRVQLAAALISRPELLVLDEPFSGLDPLGVETMAAVLRQRAAEGTAVVFSSHQLDLVEDLCEDVAIIRQGRIVQQGEVNEIKDASPVRHLELELAAGTVNELGELKDRIVEQQGNRFRLIVPADLDIRPLMSRALAGGQIRRFVYTTPSLSEIFLEAVA